MRETLIIPSPRSAVSVRPGTLADLPFIDALQKAHSKNVGFLCEKALEGKIAAGHVIVAQDEQDAALGYCIGNDKYMKREDVGIIYQLNVAPGARRKLIGATLVQALFARSAYGCRLFCCWCAQDIEANHFWEALGFIPLAFRTGSAKKARTHIFWQCRICDGDVSTPFWFPSQTNAGALREDRLVLPIPPGTSWRDAKPMILPAVSAVEGPANPTALPGPRATRGKRAKPLSFATVAPSSLSNWRFITPEPLAPTQAKRPRKPRIKNDPAHVAAARELRDKFLEQVNSGMMLPHGRAKYEVNRRLNGGTEQSQLLLGNRLSA